MAFHWPTTTIENNREVGKAFEKLFIRQAKLNGLWPHKNPLSCRLDYQGRPKLLHSQLDFRLIDPSGRVGYFDTKSFDCEQKFSFSNLNPHQIEQSAEFNQWRVPAGFVILFSVLNRVVYYPGATIKSTGPGHSFTPEMGIHLGRLESFDLKMLFQYNVCGYKERGS